MFIARGGCFVVKGPVEALLANSLDFTGTELEK